MQLLHRFQHWSDPRKDAMVLGALNVGMALVCGITFFGVLAITGFLSWWLRSSTGNPAAYVPFPYPVLLLLYVVALLVVWTRFAKGLQPRPRSRAIQTGLLGATPLFGLSLLGYLVVAWILATGDLGPDSMLVATVWIYGILSTLVLFAGLVCTAIIAFFSPRQHP